MSVLVKVPEAYLLVREYDTTRPGLLVLDADGRRVASIALSGALTGDVTAQDVAGDLRKAATAPAFEKFRMNVAAASPDRIDALRSALAALDGVTGRATKEGEIVLDVAKGALPPRRVFELARKHRVFVDLLQPVPVRFPRTGPSGPDGDPSASDLTPRLARVPGAWYVGDREPLRVFVTDLLLDPAPLEAVAARRKPDVAAREFRFEEVRTIPSGLRHLTGVLAVEGVVSVLPDLFGNSVVVVARPSRGVFDDVAAAFRASGARLAK